MKTAVVCLVLLGMVALASASVPNSLLAQWNRFKQDYNRVYTSSVEESQRFRNFAKNLERARELNQKMPSARFGVTKFMDLSVEEFGDRYLMKNMPPVDQAKLNAHYHNNPAIKAYKAPSQFDWFTQGACTPVYNQGQCGSCWAFSATETIESYWKLAGNTLAQLSMEQVVDCDTTSYGCQGGWTYSAYEYVEQAGGIDSYNSYPYTAGGGDSGSCEFSQSNVVATISGWQYVSQNDDESEMQSYLASTGPLSVCVYAEAWMTYQSGVFMASQCQGQIDHCVQATGYNMNAGTPYWIVRNSWGTDWGINGFIWLQYGQNTCSIGDVATSVTI
jgi:cysteine peptidase B